jgi:hypothetical protein
LPGRAAFAAGFPAFATGAFTSATSAFFLANGTIPHLTVTCLALNRRRGAVVS